jgi:hypothetical protein
VHIGLKWLIQELVAISEPNGNNPSFDSMSNVLVYILGSICKDSCDSRLAEALQLRFEVDTV